MRVFEFNREQAEPIHLFESVSAASVPLGDGFGEAHVYCIYLEAGARIEEHRAGFDQLFLVIEGEAWAVGEEGQRANLPAGHGAYFTRGEMQSKGSERGATAIMVQVSELAISDQASES